MEFAFAPEVTDINAVPEDFRGFYAQAGDKHTLRDDPIVKASVKTILGLNGSLKAARTEAKNYKTKVVDLSGLAEYGATPEEILASVTSKLEEAKLGGDKKGAKELENIKKALQEAHGKELTARDTRIKGLTTQLYAHLVDTTATTAIAELKGVPKLLLPFVRNQVKVDEKDGNLNVQVVDAEGNIRFGATGAPMTIKELVSEMKGQQEFGRLFESETPPGGGTPPGTGKRTQHVTQTTARDQMTSMQKIQAGLAKGQAQRPGR